MSLKRIALVGGALLGFSRVAVSAAVPDPAAQDLTANLARNVEFHIAAQPLDQALEAFERQAGVGYSLDMGRQWHEIRTPPVDGLFSITAFLNTLLEGTGLTWSATGPNHVSIHPVPQPDPGDALEGATTAESQRDAFVIDDAPEVLIQARRTLNADLRRTQDGTQPYVVIERDEIERSQAQSIEMLIGRQVTANALDNSGQGSGVQAGRSSFSLRGLGMNQTLVLVDGRRTAGLFVGGVPLQGDLSSIPLAAVQRIEILPTTASAIYGGGATGGVINIVLRHDCETRLVAGYGNTYAADARSGRAYLTHCISFGEDRTHLRIAGSFSREADLATGQRDLTQRGRDRIVQNNAAFFFNAPSPPLGARTNFRTLDGRGLNGPGSPNFGTVPEGYTSADGVTPLLGTLGQYNMDLAGSAQPDGGGLFVLRNGPETRYINATIDHQFSSAISGYLDATSSRNLIQRLESIASYAGVDRVFVAAGAPNNPFHQNLIATVPVVGGDRILESRLMATGVTAGLRLERVGLEYTKWDWKLHRKMPLATSALPAVANGTIDIFQDFNVRPLDLQPYAYESSFPSLESHTDVLTVRVGCSRFHAPAGPGMLLASLEYRNERFGGGGEVVTGNSNLATTPSSPATIFTKQGRRIASGYVETRIPVWSGEQARLADADGSANESPRGHSGCSPGGGTDKGAGAAAAWTSELAFERTVPRLELQLAGRFDRYHVDSAQPSNTFGSNAPAPHVMNSFTSVNPTIGLQFWPSRDVSLRASFGTGFLPPSGDQFAPAAPMEFPPAVFHDARRGGEPSGIVRFEAGGNPDLHPERSRSGSAGVVWKPALLSGFRVSLDYVRIDKVDNIVSPADLFFQDPAFFESLYPNRVTRAAPGSADPFEVGPIINIDATDLNIARARIDAWDLDLQYELAQSPIGDIGFWMRATRQPRLAIRATPSSASQNLAGVAGNAQKFGGVAGLVVKHGSWELSWSARYFDSYSVGQNPITIASQGSRGRVSSQTYHDASVGYHMLEHGDAMSVTILLTAQNIFNERPPFDASERGLASALGDPRMGTYAITVSAAF
jgi:outer membrane receptor protein involved in Fe transport